MLKKMVWLLPLAVLLTGCGGFFEALRDGDSGDGVFSGDQSVVEEEDRDRWFENSRGNQLKPAEEISNEQVEQVALPRTEPEAEMPGYPLILPGVQDYERFLGGAVPETFAGDELVTTDFNFKDAAMSDVVPVFSTLLKFNFVIEGALPGTVTMSMHETLSRRQLWDIFNQMLRLSGVVASYDGQIVHLRSAAAIPQELTLDSVNQNIEMGVFQIKHVPVSEIVTGIKSFLPRDIRVIEIAARNTLLLLETRNTLDRVRQLITELDQPASAAFSKAIYPCRNVTPSQVVKELREVLPILGFPVNPNADARTGNGAITLNAIDRLQVIVASAADSDSLKEVERWISTLDRHDSNQEQLYIYDIINNRAEELVKALSVMFTVTGGMVATDKSGNLIDTPNIGTASTIQSNSEVVPGSVFDVPVRIWADAVNNRLSIRTRPRTYAMIKAFLERLDTMPAQVLLQVLVLEISLNDTIAFGVEFMTKSSGGGSLESVLGTDYKYLTPGAEQDKQYGAKYWIFDPDNPDEKFGYVNALAGQTNVRIISSPQLLVISNQEATMNVGDEVPVISSEITNSASAGSTGTTLVRNVEYKTTGIVLTVTPRITRGGRISMQIKQEVSEAVNNTTSNIDSPTIQQRTVSTNMSIRDGQTIICGGLIREKVNDNLDSLPVINSIPFLRRLLGDTNISTTRTEMLVLISGTIVTEETPLEQMLRGYQQSVDSLVEFSQEPYNRRVRRFKHSGDLDKWFLE